MKDRTIRTKSTGNAKPRSGNHELLSGEIVGTNPDNIRNIANKIVAGNAMMLISFIGLDWL
jgi:hypothetical protein